MAGGGVVGVDVLPLVPDVFDAVVDAAVLPVPPVPRGASVLSLVPMPGIFCSVVVPPPLSSPSQEISEKQSDITAASASRISAICLMLFFIFVLLCFLFPNFSASVREGKRQAQTSM
jgi:hypothetical protein